MLRPLCVSIVLTTSLLLLSCSGTTKQYVSPDIKAENGNEPVSMLVIQKDDFPEISSDHSFGNLRINEQPIFEDRLNQIFYEATGAHVKHKMQSIDIDQSSFQLRKFTEGGTNLSFVAPSDGTVLGYAEQKTRFVVLLDGFKFDTYEDMVGGDSYAGHEAKVVPRMTFQTNYLIWDNTAKEAVAWGSIDADKAIVMARIQELYGDLIRDSFQKINKMGPFQKRSS